MGAVSHRSFWVALLTALDVTSKLWAHATLPDSDSVPLDGRSPDFVVALNEMGVVLGAAGAELYSTNEVFVLTVGVGLVALSALALALHRTRLWRRLAWASVPLGLMLLSGAAQWAHRELRPIGIEPATLVAALRVCATVPLVVAVAIARDAVAGAGTALVLAGAVSNGASFFYPPYAPVDFIRIDLTDSALVLNVADLYVALGVVVLLLSPLLAGARSAGRLLGASRAA